jgi:hypothetical protein
MILLIENNKELPKDIPVNIIDGIEILKPGIIGVIYELTCKDTGLSYIGKATNPINRLNNFKTNKRYAGDLINKAKEQYPPLISNWTYSIIDLAYSINELCTLEAFYIKQFDTKNNGYNTTGGSFIPLKVEISLDFSNDDCRFSSLRECNSFENIDFINYIELNLNSQSQEEFYYYYQPDNQHVNIVRYNSYSEASMILNIPEYSLRKWADNDENGYCNDFNYLRNKILKN